jgi:energy-coupling factor transporter transmembrane protein EcfT
MQQLRFVRDLQVRTLLIGLLLLVALAFFGNALMVLIVVAVFAVTAVDALRLTRKIRAGD